MLLDEEFFNAIFYSEWKFKEKHIVPNCVYVAEEFAIGFAEWVENNCDGFERFEQRELLKMYKKEKGL